MTDDMAAKEGVASVGSWFPSSLHAHSKKMFPRSQPPLQKPRNTQHPPPPLGQGNAQSYLPAGGPHRRLSSPPGPAEPRPSAGRNPSASPPPPPFCRRMIDVALLGVYQQPVLGTPAAARAGVSSPTTMGNQGACVGIRACVRAWCFHACEAGSEMIGGQGLQVAHHRLLDLEQTAEE